MSLTVDIYLWLGNQGQFSPLDFFRRLLSCVEVNKHTENINNRRFNRFKKLIVSFAHNTNIVYDKDVDTDSVDEIIQVLASYVSNSAHWQVESVFDYIGYDLQEMILYPKVGALDVHYYAPGYGHQGHYYNQFGPTRISFHNNMAFKPLEEAYRFRPQVRQSENGTLQRDLLVRLNHNFDVVIDLALRLIDSVNPAHLLVCTEAEINPLTAHAIYHRDWKDYVYDLLKIAKLHEFGGAYFTDVSQDEAAYARALKLSSDYGHLRYWKGNQKAFSKCIQAMSDTILVATEALNYFPKDKLEDCFYNFEFTELIETSGSYLLLAKQAPFAYLEEPYFKLYESVYDSASNLDITR